MRVAISGLMALACLAQAPPLPEEHSARLSRTAVNNLAGFARAFGVIRYQYPADSAVDADWAALVMTGINSLDYATYPESLGRRMKELFAEVAPGVDWYVGEAPPLRRALRGQGWTEADLVTVDLGRGLHARVPKALFRVKGKTVPAAKRTKPMPARAPLESYPIELRVVRLGGVILLWNELLHVAKPDDKLLDWNEILVRAMLETATGPKPDAYADVLRQMVRAVNPEGFRMALPGGVQVDWP